MAAFGNYKPKVVMFVTRQPRGQQGRGVTLVGRVLWSCGSCLRGNGIPARMGLTGAERDSGNQGRLCSVMHCGCQGRQKAERWEPRVLGSVARGAGETDSPLTGAA